MLCTMQLTGRRAVNVQRVLEYYDPEASHTKLIGAQVFMIQKDHGKQRYASHDLYLELDDGMDDVVEAHGGGMCGVWSNDDSLRSSSATLCPHAARTYDVLPAYCHILRVAVACRPDTSPKAISGCTGRHNVQPNKAAAPVPVGTYDLLKAKLRESGTESHKFYVSMPGHTQVTVKTETPCAAVSL
jgi:hypothetical protein